MSDPVFIASNAKDGAYWHLGRYHESRTAVTKTLIRFYHTTACQNRLLGGAWGYSTHLAVPSNGVLCPRCAAILARTTTKSA